MISGQNLQPDNGIAISLATDTTFDRPVFVYCGNSGTIKVDLWSSGASISYENVPSGYTLPFPVRKVYSTGNGTTATSLIANW